MLRNINKFYRASPKYLLFDNFKVFVNTDHYRNQLSFPNKHIDDIMTYEEIMKLAQQYNRGIDLGFYKTNMDFHNKLLMDSIKDTIKYSSILLND